MERIIQQVQFPNKVKPLAIRVAAYARVSSGKDAMLHSLSAQVSYYNQLIQNHAGWIFCGVYSDEALTGTKDDREGFQKMLSECRNGNIDLVITKSISRFARNTVTLLETVRELKSIGVDVWFEEQNIHTISADGELMLTILASYAQEESRSASENKKWQIRKDFEQGKIGSITILGYRRTPEGRLEIEPKEAELVQMIFSDYLSGMGRQAIANKLNEMGIPTRRGNLWGCTGVRDILINEKYVGIMILQKYYRENHLTKRKMRNNGELTRYLVQKSHPAIIDKETFDAVQAEMKRRSEEHPESAKKVIYPLTGMIRCGCCGKNYQRKIFKTGAYWLCATFARRGKKHCPTAKQIPEEKLFAACASVLDVPTFDETAFKKQVDHITVPAPNVLIFVKHDGTQVEVTWQDRSRSESWTPKMREKARQRAIKNREENAK